MKGMWALAVAGAVIGFQPIACAQDLAQLERQLSSKNRSERETAVQFLAGNPTDSARARLLIKVVGDPYAGIRRIVVGALGRSGQAEAFPAVKGALTDVDQNVRLLAVSSVISLQMEEGTRAVLRHLDREKSETVRARILEEILKSKDRKRAAQAELRLIEKALADGSGRVRIRALAAYVALGEPRAVAAKLSSRYRLERDKLVIRYLVAKLGEVKDDSVLKLLDTIIRNERGEVRRAALASLEHAYESNPGEATTVLLKMFQYNDDEVRKSAALAAGKFAAASVVRKLIQVAEKDSSLQVRLGAIASLGSLGRGMASHASRIAAFLQRLSGDANISIRRACLQALVGISRDVKYFQKCLEDRDTAVRSAAFNALRRIQSKAGGLALAEVLRAHPDAGVRAEAARALGEYKSYSACRSALQEAARRDRDARVRKEAQRVLGGA